MEGLKEMISKYALLGLLIIITIYSIKFLFFPNNTEYNIPIPPSTTEYKLSLESDIGRLDCVFEQRRCYYKNLGYERDSVVENCKELNYCDEAFKK